MSEPNDVAALQARLETLRLGLAHEVRTPLAVIRAKAELLPMAGPLTDDQRQLLEALITAAGRAEALLERLLDETATQAGATDVPL